MSFSISNAPALPNQVKRQPGFEILSVEHQKQNNFPHLGPWIESSKKDSDVSSDHTELNIVQNSQNNFQTQQQPFRAYNLHENMSSNYIPQLPQMMNYSDWSQLKAANNQSQQKSAINVEGLLPNQFYVGSEPGSYTLNTVSAMTKEFQPNDNLNKNNDIVQASDLKQFHSQNNDSHIETNNFIMAMNSVPTQASADLDYASVEIPLTGVTHPEISTAISPSDILAHTNSNILPASRFRRARIRETVEQWSFGRLTSHDCRLKSVPAYVIELHKKREEFRSELKTALNKCVYCYSCLKINLSELPCFNPSCVKPKVMNNYSKRALLEAALYAKLVLSQHKHSECARSPSIRPQDVNSKPKESNSPVYMHWNEGERVKSMLLDRNSKFDDLKDHISLLNNIKIHLNRERILEDDFTPLPFDPNATILRPTTLSNANLPFQSITQSTKDQSSIRTREESQEMPCQTADLSSQPSLVDPATKYLRMHSIVDSNFATNGIPTNVPDKSQINQEVSSSIANGQTSQPTPSSYSTLSDTSCVPPTSPATSVLVRSDNGSQSENIQSELDTLKNGNARLLAKFSHQINDSTFGLDQKYIGSNSDEIDAVDTPGIRTKGSGSETPRTGTKVPIDDSRQSQSSSVGSNLIEQRINQSLYLLKLSLQQSLGNEFALLQNENLQLRNELQSIRIREQQLQMLCQTIRHYVPHEVWDQAQKVTLSSSINNNIGGISPQNNGIPSQPVMHNQSNTSGIRCDSPVQANSISQNMYVQSAQMNSTGQQPIWQSQQQIYQQTGMPIFVPEHGQMIPTHIQSAPNSQVQNIIRPVLLSNTSNTSTPFLVGGNPGQAPSNGMAYQGRQMVIPQMPLNAYPILGSQPMTAQHLPAWMANQVQQSLSMTNGKNCQPMKDEIQSKAEPIDLS